jgi:hypothetical protein
MAEGKADPNADASAPAGEATESAVVKEEDDDGYDLPDWSNMDSEEMKAMKKELKAHGGYPGLAAPGQRVGKHRKSRVVQKPKRRKKKGKR